MLQQSLVFQIPYSTSMSPSKPYLYIKEEALLPKPFSIRVTTNYGLHKNPFQKNMTLRDILLPCKKL